MTLPTAKATFSFVSLGCPKNLVDSERMLGLLVQGGYVLMAEADGADLVIVNTCGFIEEARQEAMDVIGQMAALKRQGRCALLLVAGCLAERQKLELMTAEPEIDAVVGVFGRESIVEVCDQLLSGARELAVLPPSGKIHPETARLRITPRHLAYLKIAEGCDRRCTFCSIPLIRGPLVSKPIPECVGEAEELAGDGVKELCLVAQDTTVYGTDLAGRPMLAELLTELERVKGLRWIRLMYAYPHHVTDELLEVMANSRRIVPYLDLPLQHINDRILRRMGRQITRARTEELLGKLRERVPGIALRTTLLVGFPGETDEAFDELLAFVREQRFERLGAFAYSREADTPAARMKGQVPEPVRQERLDALMRTQQQIAFEANRALLGREVELLVDEPDAEEKGVWLARTACHAPDIDGCVRVTGRRLAPGRFVRATLTEAEGYDLWAEAIPKPKRR